MNTWPHEERAFRLVVEAIRAGHKRICLAVPTGGGKTYIAGQLIKYWLDDSLQVSLYTNRRLMVTQLSEVLTSFGLEHGIRAGGHEWQTELPLQISSFQTELSKIRTAKKSMAEWQLHPADRVLVDELHLNASGEALAILECHVAAGGVYVGLTATPIGLAHAIDHLIQCGTKDELRKCGALLPASHFGPDEPDLKLLRAAKIREGEEVSEAQARKAIMTPTLWGRVHKWFEELNPEHKPTILFAPGVRESLWFAEKFAEKGITSAHIDGANIWVDGELRPTSPELRKQVLDGSKEGRIAVVCNRFVLREGIDAPWLSHGIFATVFGSMQTYLQAGGRLLRNDGGSSHVTIQDHGGNWWRHCSLNEDIEWNVDFTNANLAGLRGKQLRNKKCRKCNENLDPLSGGLCQQCGYINPMEPMRCPECSQILKQGRCHNCGWVAVSPIKSRPVVTIDGTLKQMVGDIYRPRSICKRSDGPQIWERMYWRSRTEKGARTFAAAMAMFAGENNWQWPDPAWPLMPVADFDFYRLVKDVPFHALTSVPERACKKEKGGVQNEASPTFWG